ncbi:hypothetical protein D3C76_650810 [compost metagenome]
MGVGRVDQYVDLAKVLDRQVGERLALFGLGDVGGDFQDLCAVAGVADGLFSLVQHGRGAGGQHHGLRLILRGTHGQLDTQTRADTGNNDDFIF